MKQFLKISAIIFISIGLVAIMQSCKKKPTIPVLTTASVSAITQTSAVSGGNVTDDGGAEVTARGVCWNTLENQQQQTARHPTVLEQEPLQAA